MPTDGTTRSPLPTIPPEIVADAECPRCGILDGLDLPTALEQIGHGLRVAGHRVSLFHVLDALLDGTSIERMGEMFPTIPPPKLEEVVSFCERHIDLMRRYHAEQRAAFAAGVGRRVGEAPSLAELRRRRTEGGDPGDRTD